MVIHRLVQFCQQEIERGTFQNDCFYKLCLFIPQLALCLCTHSCTQFIFCHISIIYNLVQCIFSSKHCIPHIQTADKQYRYSNLSGLDIARKTL